MARGTRGAASRQRMVGGKEVHYLFALRSARGSRRRRPAVTPPPRHTTALHPGRSVLRRAQYASPPSTLTPYGCPLPFSYHPPPLPAFPTPCEHSSPPPSQHATPEVRNKTPHNRRRITHSLHNPAYQPPLLPSLTLAAIRFQGSYCVYATPSSPKVYLGK